jgi:type I restriction enzyme S subunit
MTLRLHPDQIVGQASSPLLAIAPWWERVRLGDIAHVINGAAFKSALFNNDGRGQPLVRIRDVGRDRAQVHYDGPYEDREVIKHGDLLVGMDGDFRAARWLGQRALLNQRVCRVAVTDPALYSERFLLHILQPYLDAVHAVTSSVTVKHLSSRTIQDLPIPLPPRREQERIVAAIEEHLSRLDAATTGTARAVGRAYALRAHLIEASMRTAGDLVTLEHLAATGGITDGPFGSKLKSSHYTSTGPRVIRLENIGVGEFIDEETHIAPEYFEELQKHEVVGGDLVVASLVSDRLRACVVPMGLGPAIVKADCIRVRLKEEADPRFLNYALMRPSLKDFVSQNIRGVGRSRLGLANVRQIPVPMAPPEVQRRIADELDRGLTVLARLEAQSTGALRRAHGLRRSVLAAAFSGQLVPQDPADEPASVLLDGIRAERAAGPRKRAGEAKVS